MRRELSGSSWFSPGLTVTFRSDVVFVGVFRGEREAAGTLLAVGPKSARFRTRCGPCIRPRGRPRRSPILRVKRAIRPEVADVDSLASARRRRRPGPSSGASRPASRTLPVDRIAPAERCSEVVAATHRRDRAEPENARQTAAHDLGGLDIAETFCARSLIRARYNCGRIRSAPDAR